jgi:cytoskeletal protein RodZ
MASFGDSLRRERELRAISLREIADATKISIRFLQALEQDRLDLLPGGMFPRAFVRQYASHLGLDVERTLADFTQVHPEAPVEKVVREPPPPSPWSGRLWAIAGGILLLSVVLLSRRPASKDRRASGPAPLPAIASSPLPVSVPAASATPQPGVEGLVLTLTADQECWVEAQVDGHPVLNRVLVMGEKTTIEAASEIRLSVGNAGGLSLSLNNLPGLPLGRNGEVKKNILINRDSLPALVHQTASIAPSSSG